MIVNPEMKVIDDLIHPGYVTVGQLTARDMDARKLIDQHVVNAKQCVAQILAAHRGYSSRILITFKNGQKKICCASPLPRGNAHIAIYEIPIGNGSAESKPITVVN